MPLRLLLLSSIAICEMGMWLKSGLLPFIKSGLLLPVIKSTLLPFIKSGLLLFRAADTGVPSLSSLFAGVCALSRS